MASQRQALSELGPEGIRETQEISALTAAIVVRVQGLRAALDSARTEPVFRRLLKSSGYLTQITKTLRELIRIRREIHEL